jgi:anti-sigma regulatory factor (Ser/Thr protein kinase)
MLPSEGPTRRVAFSFPAESSAIAEVRHLIVAEARTLPFSQDELDDLALALSEAFTNLVQHAQGHRIRGSCEVDARQVSVSFELDGNPSPYLQRRPFPAGLASGGRGIPLLQMLVPSVSVVERPDGHYELRLVKPLAEAAKE